jgi:hypothetical protein
MARDLGISPLAAEYILQALRPVVHDHVDLDVVGGTVGDLDDPGPSDSGF